MPRHEPPQTVPAWRRPRWRYAVLAFLLGVGYTLTALLLGFEFRLDERDFTLAAGALVETSFAGFGYLLGLVTEARHRERAAAKRAAERQWELSRLRTRLAQAEKLASLGELSSALGHELRNPLAILRSMAQNLAESRDTDEVRSTCREMLEEIDRLARVTARLIDFARPLEPKRSRVRVAEIAERARLLAGELLRDHPLALAVRSGPRDLEADADPDLLCQVLLGLLENAAAAAPPGSELELAWGIEGGEEIEITVADHGPGVPPDVRAQIFEPFFTTREGGHGLGLAVARQIVEAHGGTIEALDRPEGGAIFRLCLPASVRLEKAA